MHKFLVVTIFLASFSSVAGLECYFCDGQTRSGCNDDYVGEESSIKVCDNNTTAIDPNHRAQSAALVDLMSTESKPYGCLKFVQKLGDTVVTQRGCIDNSKVLRLIDYCSDVEEDKHACICFSDGCNGGYPLTFSYISIISAVVAAIVYHL